MSYRVQFAPSIRLHLASLTKREQELVLEAIQTQLSYEPTSVTRQRKELRTNPLAPWELRVGDLRVLYDINEADQRVDIVLIGRKVREKLYVAGIEVKL
jgi:mRNA-degrading endonuclease RelE of RelBE toxin-antitoxin system